MQSILIREVAGVVACRSSLSIILCSRGISAMAPNRSGVLLGIYQGTTGDDITFTKATQEYVNQRSSQLSDLIKISGLAEKAKKVGACRVFHGLETEYSSVGIVSLGKQDAGYNVLEQIDETRENVRVAVASGLKQLADAGVTTVAVEPCGDAEAAAEAATMCLDVYDDLKTEKKPRPTVSCFTHYTDDAASVSAQWDRGVILGEGQNLARRLMEAPANVMTPTAFAHIAQDVVAKVPGVTVTVHDKAWAQEKKMGCYLSVAQGSDEPLKFVEVSYEGGKAGDPAFALVGKGITFDSGGISIKASANMDAMRSDMGGAACSLASVYTAARLGVKQNIRAFMPLTENMPSGKATKPGDVFTSMSGKTVQVDNTDAEGRLVLCDALAYAQTYTLSGILDMATLTGAMVVSLGAAAAGCFANNDEHWTLLHKAGTRTGDRVWRMPLFKLYVTQMTEAPLADVNNISNVGAAGGSCTAAAFLSEFVQHERWMHLDIAGVMINKTEVPYIPKGMAGRPTRTVVEFLNSLPN